MRTVQQSTHAAWVKTGLSIAVAVAIGALAVGCNGEMPRSAASGSSTVSTQSTPSLLRIRFVDFTTGALIVDPLEVRFKGARVLRSPTGQDLSDQVLQTTTGEVRVVPTFDVQDLVLLVGNRSLGYVETGQFIGPDAAKGEDTPLVVKLIRVTTDTVNAINQSPAAISAGLTEGVLNPNGRLGTFSLSTPQKIITTDLPNDTGSATSSINMGSVSVSFSDNTQVLNEQGQTVSVRGPVTLTALHYSAYQKESLKQFPGGFMSPVKGSKPSNMHQGRDGVFLTGGFASINLRDASGQALRYFDKPIQMSIDIPKTTHNLETGRPYKVGDTFPVFSFAEATGEWTYETQGLVQDKQPPHPDLLTVTYTANHLTGWNLDGYGATCPTLVKLPATANKADYTFDLLCHASMPCYTPDNILRKRGRSKLNDLVSQQPGVYGTLNELSNERHVEVLGVPQIGGLYKLHPPENNTIEEQLTLTTGELEIRRLGVLIKKVRLNDLTCPSDGGPQNPKEDPKKTVIDVSDTPGAGGSSGTTTVKF